MADVTNLEKLGRELKCPICLSLLNSAVSLTCNHVFCNSCIGKSMKSASDCPVCKVPFRRREIRPAPHMDNLVTIYKNMEVASGVDMFISQTGPSAKASGDEKEVENGKTSEKQETNKSSDTHSAQTVLKKCRRKGSKRSSRSAAGVSDPVKPSFPTKKRVQVPQHPPPETPLLPTTSRAAATSKTESQKYSDSLKEPRVFENGEPFLTPFFWLREEEDAEKSSQHSDEDQSMGTPPDAPCFSDIKDSDDDLLHNLVPNEETCVELKNADIYDSEMFEWTQRPCSPELCSIPMRLQVEASGECGVHEGKTGTVTEDLSTTLEDISKKKESSTDERGIENEGMKFPSSSPANKIVNSNCGTRKSGKRVLKETRSIPNKRVKNFRDQESGKHMKSPQKTDGNKENMDSNVDTLEGNSSGNHIIDVARTTEMLSETTVLCSGAGLINHDDDPRSCDPSTLPGKRDKTTDALQLRSRAALRNRKLNSTMHGITGLCNDALLAHPLQESLPTYKTNEIPDFNGPARGDTVDCDGKKMSSKWVKFSEDDALKNKAANSSQILHAANINETTSKIPGNPESEAKSSLTKTANIQCAFCRSTEDSEVSGVMVHYLNGKPVDENWSGRSDVIHVHRSCTEWAPNVYFQDDNVVNLERELARSRRIKCGLCGIKGAALGCYKKSCQRSFHVPCAKLTPQCRWDHENFVMLCPAHATSKLPNEQKKEWVPKRSNHIQRPKAVDKKECIKMLWKTHEKTKHMVLCCSALSNAEKGVVSEFERSAGVTVIKNWDSSVTHVIASTDENGACRRTLKFLMGILEGKWILDITWIKACMNSKELVDEQHYEIEVDIHGIRNGPRLGRMRLLHEQPKLFMGCKFYFMGEFEPSYKGYLHDLVTAAGGTVLSRKPISEEQNNSLTGCSLPTTFIIYNIELPEKCDASKSNLILSHRRSDADALASSTGAVAASNSWILNSIAGCKLQDLTR